MLRSEEVKLIAQEKNNNYGNMISKIETEIKKFSDLKEKLKTEHKKDMEILLHNYHIAKAIEKAEAEKLSKEFDNYRNQMFDFYSEKEIRNILGDENFEFLADMKYFQLCGFDEDYIYTPTWEYKKSVCCNCKYYEVCGDDHRTEPCKGKENK